jgi:hypothetical protein
MEGQILHGYCATVETIPNELTESLGFSETIDVKRQRFEWIAFINWLELFVCSERFPSRVRDDGRRLIIPMPPDSVMPVHCLYVEITLFV